MEELINHLKDRGMDPSKYPIGFDTKEGVITWFLHNGTGDIVGYQQYRPAVDEKKKKNDPKSGRYYTHLPREVDGVFGWEQIDHQDRTIYVVEGIFKAATLHRLGYNSIAVLTSTPKRLKPWFKILRAAQWDLVGIGDNDPAGAKLVNIVGKGFQSREDVDEMAEPDIHQALSEFMLPPMAA